MVDYQVVIHSRYGHKYWRNHDSYAFAAEDAVCPLVAQELPRAMLALAIAFIPEGGSFLPVALQGLTPGKNLLVSPDGRWMTTYIPTPYRGYPFRMASTEQGEQVLCVDDASGLISDETGNPFFNEDMTPGDSVMELVGFFRQIEANRVLTHQACAVLQQYNLIQPWPITINGEGPELKVEGLFRIDEAALNALPAEALIEVRAVGGLTIAYCQLLSMQHLPALGKLADAHAEAEREKQAQNADSNLGFMSEGSTFSFGN